MLFRPSVIKLFSIFSYILAPCPCRQKLQLQFPSIGKSGHLWLWSSLGHNSFVQVHHWPSSSEAGVSEQRRFHYPCRISAEPGCIALSYLIGHPSLRYATHCYVIKKYLFIWQPKTRSVHVINGTPCIGVGIRTCVFVLKILCQRSDKKIASLKQKMPPSMQQCVRFFLNHCS